MLYKHHTQLDKDTEYSARVATIYSPSVGEGHFLTFFFLFT